MVRLRPSTRCRGEESFQGLRFPKIGILTEAGIFLAVVFIGDGYGVLGGNETHRKTDADKTGAAFLP
jgi:hypothetical protein